MPLPEPADATFTILLRETRQTGARGRRAWAQLVDHLIAGERDADQDELHGLIAYCHERLALLNGPDADFILSHERARQTLCGDAPASTLDAGYRPSAATFGT